MVIRKLNSDDITELKKTYNKFYSKHFEFPDFSKFFGSYVITDIVGNKEEIITAGGVRPIAEGIIITNKSKSTFTRTKALLKILEINKRLCKENNLDQLHAFVSGSTWKNRMSDVGFKPCKGDALYIDIE